jgi:predicted dehydrogenase
MYKCAIIGVSGGRARGQAEAYQHIEGGRLVAVSTRQQDKLDAFAETFDVSARYTDYREMFVRERPDVVHVNTPPNVRLEIFEAAQVAGIPALIVEKPLAIQWEDFQAIREFARTSTVKIAINHQLQFHPRRLVLQKLVQDGAIGDVRFIDASSGMNMAYQGTHTLQAIGAFNKGGVAKSVFAQIGGADGLAETPRMHFAPDEVQGAITYDNGVQALLRCGPNAPKVGDGPINTHKRIAVYGTQGFVEWTMWSWQIGISGRVESGVHNYDDEDILGQAAMTEAMFDWLDDDSEMHPLNLNAAIRDFETMLAIYESGLSRRIVTLPSLPVSDLINKMRRTLDNAPSDHGDC